MKDGAEPSGSVAGRNDDSPPTASDQRERRVSALKNGKSFAALTVSCASGQKGFYGAAFFVRPHKNVGRPYFGLPYFSLCRALAGTAFRTRLCLVLCKGDAVPLDPPAKGWRALGWAHYCRLFAVQYLFCDPAATTLRPSKGKTSLILSAASQGVQTTHPRQQATNGSAAFRRKKRETVLWSPFVFVVPHLALDRRNIACLLRCSDR